MKYLVLRENKKEMFIEGDSYETNILEDAVEMAESEWNHLSRMEQKKYNIIVLESANPDEALENHFDGDVLWTAK